MAEDALERTPGTASGDEASAALSIRKIGVIGAGQMGNGIAHVAALSGYDVALNDLSRTQFDAAIEIINGNMARQVSKGKISEGDKDEALSRISFADSLAALGDADLVIEAVTEDEDVKRKILAGLCPALKEGAILASNTSSISITRLAATTDRPERFIGMHFMNPVPVMKLVELIRGIATADDTFRTARAFVQSMDKTVAVAEDFPAFIVNRILLPMINEAVYTGPLQLADFIGLDTCLSVMQVLYEGLADSKYRPCPLMVKYVEAGWLGRKAGRGFYDYRTDPPVPTR